MKYTTLLFDLDNTLYDFTRNSGESLLENFNKYNLLPIFGSFDSFSTFFRKHSEGLWEMYRQGLITKEKLNFQRFYQTFADFGIFDEDLSRNFCKDYMTSNLTKSHAIPYTIEILRYLRPKYKIHIVTNGFSELQTYKLQNTGVVEYIDLLITSEEAGVMKPYKEFFEYALQKANEKAENCIIIGDDLAVDILGAKNAGIDQIYFNPCKKIHSEQITFEIKHLSELKAIL